MEKIEEKNLKKKSENFDETLILNDLNEIISKKEIKNTPKENTKSVKAIDDKQIIKFDNAKDNKQVIKSSKPEGNKQVTKSGKELIKEAEKIVNNIEKKETNNKELIEDQTIKNKQKKNRKALKLLLLLMFIILFAVIF